MRSHHAVARSTKGSALIEFAVAVPLLVVFIVGIYDFSAAFNQKQKIEHAALSGAIAGGALPTGDLDPAVSDPASLQPVAAVVFNSLAADGVLPLANQGTCLPPTAASSHPTDLSWAYSVAGCPDTLTITIDRGVVDPGPPATVSTQVTVRYLYHWRFNSVIQLLVPGASYAATTDVTESAMVHNQM